MQTSSLSTWTSPAFFSRLARVTLLFTIGVILWGAFVRATGSGAGCGSHWPLCDGEVIPTSASLQKIIEYTHRATSGLNLLLVIFLTRTAFKVFPQGHPVQFASFLSLIAILLEAALGAGLVLLELVAHDRSVSRALSIVLHLGNTSFLTGALTWTTLLASAEPPRSFLPSTHPERRWAISLLLGFVLVGMAGALAALGDTLFQVASLREGIQQDFAPQSHFLQRLRVLHPLLAVSWGMVALTFLTRRPQGRLALFAASAVGANLAFGVLNLLLLAPTWGQLVHLALANLIWISLIATVCKDPRFRMERRPPLEPLVSGVVSS